ncbi:MAG: magnesium and cobalt transport protein CorA [Candidatus Izemoplasmatales bacterium]
MNLNIKRNLPPGSAVYTGQHQVETKIQHVIYNKDILETTDSLELKPEVNDWIMFKGLSDASKIKSVCENFGVDPLVIEDILNVNQRNKIEFFETYVFAVLSYSYLSNKEIKHDYFSVLLFKDKLISFHEHNTFIFDEIYKRLENNKGMIRKGKLDYLFYVILDTILDNDIFVEKEISMQTLKLEEDIIQLESANQSQFYGLRKELLYLKKTIDPIYDSFVKADYKKSLLISREIDKYFDDIFDHMKRIYDDINTGRELLRNLLDVHMNNVSNRMNSIMKTLTIFSAIFIPLSFLTGFFGMNFHYFDILQNPYGLLIFGGITLGITIGMILFFKSRKWF